MTGKKMEKRLKVIYTLRLHVELQKLGFNCVTEMKNPKKPNYNCWVYEVTPEFIEAFSKIVEGKDNV